MKLVRQLPSEDVSWQVAPPCSTQRTSGNNPTVWHGSDRGRDDLTASIATNGEVAEPGLGLVPHRDSIGEYKTNICKGFSSNPQDPIQTVQNDAPLILQLYFPNWGWKAAKAQA
jgi:hypothetical protein